MRILPMLTLAALALAQTPVHTPRDIAAAAKVWQMSATVAGSDSSSSRAGMMTENSFSGAAGAGMKGTKNQSGAEMSSQPGWARAWAAISSKMAGVETWGCQFQSRVALA